MSAEVWLFAGWCVLGIMHFTEMILKMPCRWLSYWCTYILLVAGLAAEIL